MVARVEGHTGLPSVQFSLFRRLDLFRAGEKSPRPDPRFQKGAVVGPPVEGRKFVWLVFLFEKAHELILEKARARAVRNAVVNASVKIGRANHVEVEVDGNFVEFFSRERGDVVLGAQKSDLLVVVVVVAAVIIVVVVCGVWCAGGERERKT